MVCFRHELVYGGNLFTRYCLARIVEFKSRLDAQCKWCYIVNQGFYFHCFMSAFYFSDNLPSYIKAVKYLMGFSKSNFIVGPRKSKTDIFCFVRNHYTHTNIIQYKGRIFAVDVVKTMQRKSNIVTTDSYSKSCIHSNLVLRDRYTYVLKQNYVQSKNTWLLRFMQSAMLSNI